MIEADGTPLLGMEGIWRVFRERLPRLDDQKLAAAIAGFLESTPHAAMLCDDGAMAPNIVGDMDGEVIELVRQLKEFAGSAYPYTITEVNLESGDLDEFAPGDVAACIGCGCDDFHACWDDEAGEPCSWLRLDRFANLGVCSACPEYVEDWDRGDREIHVPVRRGKDSDD